jgi:peptidoglycan/xylan/chitin deacetylase (PgdA/CDA1 family)
LTSPYPLILMYHRVAEPHINPNALSVTPKHFAEHLEVLRKVAYPVRLDQLVRSLRSSAALPGRIAITFDDGYADNLTAAKPLLERHEIPATVFVTASESSDRPAFWWDELERIVLLQRELPQRLELFVNGTVFSYDLRDEATCTGNTQRSPHWRAWDDSRTIRHALYKTLCPIFLQSKIEDQRKLLRDIQHWAGVSGFDSEAVRRLTDAEIESLAGGDLIEIGGHTVSHPRMSALTRDDQFEEIQRNRLFLGQLLGRSVTSFAYPYGDYSRETLQIVSETGLQCACSTILGSVQSNTDPFQLPRRHVWDFNGDEFASWLSQVWITH